MKQLKAVQMECLKNLAKSDGRWKVGCGWMWGQASRTENILSSMVPRGLVVRTGAHHGYSTFEITPIGRKVAGVEGVV